MQLTRTQSEVINRAYDLLKKREMPFFSGIRNGKTFSMQRLVELTGTTKYESHSKIINRHPEDPTVLFIEHIRFPRVDKIATENLMRMILKAIGEQARSYRGDCYDVREGFADAMFRARANNEVYAVSLDNAENLPEKAYSVLKELNEYRTRGKDVGIAFALAGHYERMKMPYWFHDLCAEIPFAKITGVDEIKTFIANWYPEYKHHFGTEAIKQLQRCPTTGVMRKAMRSVAEDIAAGYADTVIEADLAKVVDKISEKYLAQAA